MSDGPLYGDREQQIERLTAAHLNACRLATERGEEIAHLKAELTVVQQHADAEVQRSLDLAAQLAEAQQARERMTDLVRYQRHELHTTGLITDEEYAALVQHEGAVARLEGYDKMKKERDTANELLRRAHDKDLRDIAFHVPVVTVLDGSIMHVCNVDEVFGLKRIAADLRAAISAHLNQEQPKC